MRLLLDEMYTPAIAEALRERGRDALSAHERPDLAGARDAALFAAMQAEERTILTNNVRDFVPLATEALRAGSTFYGLILTSDKSLPRTKATIGAYVKLLDDLMRRRSATDGLAGEIRWLTNA